MCLRRAGELRGDPTAAVLLRDVHVLELGRVVPPVEMGVPDRFAIVPGDEVLAAGLLEPG